MRSRNLLLVLLTTLILVSAAIVPFMRVLVGGAVLLAPGYVLWRWIDSVDMRLPALTQPALVIGLSLSIIPVVFLWAGTLGLVLTPLVLRLLLLGTALLALWFLAYRSQGYHARRLWRQWELGTVSPRLWLSFGLFGLLGLVLAARLYQAREVVLPLWVDSVHHALMIRVIGETGRIPLSLRPYLPVDQLPYHWGYHAVAAVWLAGTSLPLAQLMLLSGQVLNAMHVLTVYALTAYLSRSELAGIFAGLVTGLLSIMPAYYVTWGRYTQLTGLLLLPALMILSCQLIERPRLSARLLVGAGLTLAGMILVHYRVLVFYGAFMLPYTLLFVLRHPRRIIRTAGTLAAVALLGLLLAGPWLAVLAREVLAPAVEAPTSLIGGESYNRLEWSLLFTMNSYALYSLAAAGFGLALVARRRRVVAVAGWIGVLFLIANPDRVGLRPLWLINNHSVIITLFLPVSVLVGFGAAYVSQWIARQAPRRTRPALRLLPGALILCFAALGLWQFRDVVNPATNFATPADLPALAWAAEHTAPDARFLIGARPWLGNVHRGTDAGWWLTPLAGRWTSTPPVLYTYGLPEYVSEVEARGAAVAALRLEDQQALDALIEANQITHIFIGGTSGPLKGEMFWGRPEYEAVYDHDGVLIFRVVPVG